MHNAFASREFNINPLKPISALFNIPQHITSQDPVLQDYIKFFTTEEGADMLPYSYLDDGGAYDNLMKDKERYYLFNDEVELIRNHSVAFKKYLSDIVNIIEIGPGSAHSLANKTLPIINYAKTLENYYALDICENYLKNIYSYIKSRTENINILPLEANFKNMGNINLNANSEKSCIMFLGSTLGNFNESLRNHILNEIAKLTKKNDIFMLTFDTNQNYKLSLKAYDNINFYRLVDNILHYFARECSDFLNYQNYFQAKSEWNDKDSLIETYFRITKTLDFYLHNYGIISLKEGQKLKGISIYKFDRNRIVNMIQSSSFKVIDILNNSNKMQVFICKRL